MHFGYVFLCLLTSTLAYEDKEITKDILDKYMSVGQYGRPVVNASEPLEVTVRFSLVQLIEIDLQKQVFNFVGWVYLSWKDQLLSWNPSDRNDQQHIVIPRTQVWTPDIIVQNAIEISKPPAQSNVRVKYNGEVLWVQQFHYRTTCQTVPRQTNTWCKVKFGSWSYTKQEISLKPGKNRIDIAYYVADHTWELLSTQAKENIVQYDCCPDSTYGDVTYTLNLRKRVKPEDKEDKTKDSSAPFLQHNEILIASIFLLLSSSLLNLH